MHAPVLHQLTCGACIGTSKLGLHALCIAKLQLLQHHLCLGACDSLLLLPLLIGEPGGGWGCSVSHRRRIRCMPVCLCFVGVQGWHLAVCIIMICRQPPTTHFYMCCDCRAGLHCVHPAREAGQSSAEATCSKVLGPVQLLVA